MQMETNQSSTPLSPDPPFHYPEPRTPIDTATLVSIGSSCVILISGAIAVVCLIVYMKKSEQQMQRFRLPVPVQSSHALSVCAKCGATLALTRFDPTKRSIGVTTELTTDLTTDDTSRRQIEESETALYAISGEDLEKRDGNCGYLGVILGHISEDLETTYNTDCNQIKANDTRRQPTTATTLCSHSQCSSTQDSDLIRLQYDFNAFQRFGESFSVYESIGSEREDTPTDPGIREFTKSPPKPNERRQGVVTHSLTSGHSIGHSLNCDDTRDDATDDSTTPTTETTESHFGAIPRYRSRRPQWMIDSNCETIKCFSSLTADGLSSEDEDDSDQKRRPLEVTIDC